MIDFFDKYPREYYVFGFFLMFIFAIISKTFSYTYLNHDFYTELADNQQMGEITMPVSRGSIYFTDGKNLMATSVSLNNLSIDPTMEGNKAKLALFLTDIVYKQTCDRKSQMTCYDNILRFLKIPEIEDFEINEDKVKDIIAAEILKKLKKENVTSVLLKENLEEEEYKPLEKLNLKGVYLNKTKSLYINPEEIAKTYETAKAIQENIGGDLDNIKSLISKRKIRYLPIIKKLSILNFEEVRDYIDNELEAYKAGIVKEEDLIYKFLILEPHPDRFYPEKKLASQISGFLDNNATGHYGLEGYYNDILTGTAGKTITKRDIRGRPIDPFSISISTLVSGGANIQTTIDRSIQKKMQGLIEQGVKEYNANRGTIVVMNPKTGEIISMASYPTFDANNPGEVYEIEKIAPTKYVDPYISLIGKGVLVEDSIEGEDFFYDGEKLKLREATREELSNRIIVKYKYKNDFGANVYQNPAITSLYEPGSIMKAITVATGIDSEEIGKNEFYQDNGKVVIDQFTITNVSSKCLGYKTFGNALAWSCNVGMVRIVQKIGKALLFNYFKEFGFGEKTGITLDGEISGKVDPYEKWSTAKLFTSSYGLGVSVTPLQMITAYSALANGGIYIKPTIVKKIKFPSGRELEFKPEKIRRVITEKNSKIVTSMLVAGVNDGAAANGKVEGYAVAGKTGTAQISYRGIYEKGQASTNGSFVGYGPAEDPKFVILVKLERPRTSIYGGSTSAYIFSKASKFLFDYYGIPQKNLN